MTSTPGPNNALVLISGARFGLQKTLPLILGIAFGVAFQLMVIGLGLHQVFLHFPQFQSILSLIGSAYILWLAWKIASSGPLNARLDEKPAMGFLQGAVFQWLNPKAWMMSISTVSTYFAASQQFIDITYAALILMLISIPCVGIWAIAGKFLRQLLIQAKFAFIFNLSMAIALLIAVLPVCFKFITLQS
ncbi:LysE family translocator [Acinetobacter sp. ACNIH2]|uniref:LysE family translocator n=1 Tax=Acinetobacter sp. ACNIH2 TaxID=1758189 RepID=UPI001D1721A2|nr:LysE family translocator [Acinetobacter sp. ACNIH2]